jgi:hypothetical protein
MNLIRDPLHDYRHWYGAGFEFTIHDSDVHHKFWDMEDLHTLLEASITGTVLVQRQESYGWKMVFSYLNDRDCFQNNYTHRKIPKIEVDNELRTQVDEWMKVHVRGQSRILNTVGKMHVSIRDVSEEVHFKLRWYKASTENN